MCDRLFCIRGAKYYKLSSKSRMLSSIFFVTCV
nr:MAG TPA: hypothetical protein [Caudoviricetes sp.]